MADEKYYVAAGKAVTSKKGILGEGEKVLEKDFVGGKSSIERLLNNKTLTKKKPSEKPEEKPEIKAGGAEKK